MARLHRCVGLLALSLMSLFLLQYKRSRDNVKNARNLLFFPSRASEESLDGTVPVDLEVDSLVHELLELHERFGLNSRHFSHHYRMSTITSWQRL